MDFAQALAKAALEISAIQVNPHKPFTWASGYHMPIYNDNRKLLGSYAHRHLVTNSFVQISEFEGLDCDLVAGTVTAGIAPAASLAIELGKPLVFLYDNKPYAFSPDFMRHVKRMPVPTDANLIMSTCPWGIPLGVAIANHQELPFAYVRPAKKEHGLQQQIEGRIQLPAQAMLINQYLDASGNYEPAAVDALQSAKIDLVHTVRKVTPAKPKDITGKTILHVEDLVSMGGSAVKEINVYRALGATVTDCLSIFSYDLDDSKKAFADANCNLRPILTYPQLLEAMRDAFSSQDMATLQEWREDPLGWGAKHGFLKAT